jgi:hypothetical protein
MHSYLGSLELKAQYYPHLWCTQHDADTSMQRCVFVNWSIRLLPFAANVDALVGGIILLHVLVCMQAPEACNSTRSIRPGHLAPPALLSMNLGPSSSGSSSSSLIKPDFSKAQIRSLRRMYPMQSPLMKPAASLRVSSVVHRSATCMS